MEKSKKYLESYGRISCIVVCVIAVYGMLVYTHGSSYEHKLSVSFLDVGQGDSIFIKTPSGHTMIIDGGPSKNSLEKVTKILSFFEKDIDIMLATHPDADHITGLIPILEKYKVGTIVISPTHSSTDVDKDLDKHIEEEQASLHVAHTGDTIDFHDGVLVSVLYPSQKYIPIKDTNDGSVSIVITYQEHTFLLTGDLPSKEEAKLLPFLSKNITVYKAGHHGSKTSSSQILLSYIHPLYAVISAGKNNRYGHPSGETLDRLHVYAKEIISTIDRGTISFISDGSKIQVETAK